jgi:hypothetical protein
VKRLSAYAHLDESAAALERARQGPRVLFSARWNLVEKRDVYERFSTRPRRLDECEGRHTRRELFGTFHFPLVK